MNRIKDLRVSMGWKQDDLADRMNTSKSVISRYENGKLGLSIEAINQLCDLFDCTSDYLLCRSSIPSAGISEEDAELLRLFHDASKDTQEGVRMILRASLPKGKSEAS